MKTDRELLRDLLKPANALLNAEYDYSVNGIAINLRLFDDLRQVIKVVEKSIQQPGDKEILVMQKSIIEQFQRILGVSTTTEALSKLAVLMREDDQSEKLLSKALGHLATCPEPEAVKLHDEILSAFGGV